MAKSVKFAPWRKSAERVSSDPGSRIKKKYSAYYDDEGRLQLEQVGTIDLYEEIQSYAESVDINTILARYAMGDAEVLQKTQGFYFDATEVPKNTADLLNKLMKAEYEFDKMPIEFKERFGNDFTRFLCTYDPVAIAKSLEEPQVFAELPIEEAKEVKSDE